MHHEHHLALWIKSSGHPPTRPHFQLSYLLIMVQSLLTNRPVIVVMKQIMSTVPENTGWKKSIMKPSLLDTLPESGFLTQESRYPDRRANHYKCHTFHIVTVTQFQWSISLSLLIIMNMNIICIGRDTYDIDTYTKIFPCVQRSFPCCCIDNLSYHSYYVIHICLHTTRWSSAQL